MMRTFAQRLRDLREAAHFQRFLESNGHDFEEDCFYLRQELDFDAAHFPGRCIMPNDRGIHLILRWNGVKYRAYCLRYLLTGADPHLHFVGEQFPDRGQRMVDDRY